MKSFGIEVRDSIVALWYEINELATIVKVIMMVMGKSQLEGGSLENKGKSKVPEPRLNVGKRNAQKTKEFIDDKEQDVVASYTLDEAFVARWKLSGLKQKWSLKDYMKEFIIIMWDIREMSEREKLNALLDGLSQEVAREL